MEPLVVYVTTSNEEEAAAIARALVEERLAACANIICGVRSVYRWEGEVQDDRECLMVIKTTADNLPALKERVVGMHSYDCPEVVALSISGGHKPYLDWLDESTK